MTRIVRFSPRTFFLPVMCAAVAGAVTACGSSDLDPIVASDETGSEAGAVNPAPSSSAETDGGTGSGHDAGSGDATTGNDGARDGGDGGGGITSASTCKRGIASTTTPPAALAAGGSVPGVTWWYDWSNEPADAGSAFEFVPMIWGSGALAGPIPSGARYLLGFNEPNFTAQSDLTPTQAAADWPQVEALAKGAGIPIVSPAVNFCGGCSDPSITDPYTWLKDFFSACPGCEVDAVAVHWYNCDLPSLQAYIEGNEDAGGGLQGFTQFKKPIWLTEFSCDATHSEADQEAFMKAAIPYLEASPYVQRYSWFSAGPIPNALLVDGNGGLTDLGKTYIALPQTSCD